MEFKSFFFSLIFVSNLVLAASPQFKFFNTQAQLEKGETERISIDALGQLSLAPKVQELTHTQLPYLWCSTVDTKGNIYVGGGNPAVVLRINKAQKIDTFFVSQDLSVFSLTYAHDRLYIATSPDGKIYEKSLKNEEQVIFEPETKYIWAVEPGSGKTVYVATGEPARIYKIPSGGDAEVVFESDEQHIRSLFFDKHKQILYAGSGGNGYLYRLYKDEKVDVLYDSHLDEIHKITLASNGKIYIAAASVGTIRPGLPTAAPTPLHNIIQSHDQESAITLPSTGESFVTETTSGKSIAGGNLGAIYEVDESGFAKKLWTSRTERAHSLHLVINRHRKKSSILNSLPHLLLGTGDKGKIYRIEQENIRSLLFDAKSSQITSLTSYGDSQIIATTANPGTVQMLNITETRKNSTGRYISAVIDAAVPSQWGTINWWTNNEGRIKFLTRTGNTGKPDKTWSEWAEIKESKSGGAIEGQASRFLQWQVKLEAGTKQQPIVKKIKVSYLQKNVAPQIKKITIYKPGDAFPDAKKNAANHLSDSQKSNSNSGKKQSPRSGRKVYEDGAQSVGWQASDENNDQLEFELKIKTAEENKWHALAKNYSGHVYTFDSRSLPDDEYQIKVIASDKPSTPSKLAETSEKTSEFFWIDNTPPELGKISIKSTVAGKLANFNVTDELSPIREAWYALDAGEWHLLYPVDHVADQRYEEYAIELTDADIGKILAVKIFDINGNIGFGKIRITH